MHDATISREFQSGLDYILLDPDRVALQDVTGQMTLLQFMSRASDIAEQAKSKGVKVKIPLQVTPGSEMIRGTIERDGQMKALKDIGANVLANACGP